MQEITIESAAKYLQRTGLVKEEIVSVEPLGWGVSNLVLRICTPGRWYVLKQSRAQLRTKELWLSAPERIFREAQVMQRLAALLPVGVVPQVFHVDWENYCILIEHAPQHAVVWKGELLAGRIAPEVAAFAGKILGTIHARTCQQACFQKEFGDRRIFWQLRTDPFYLRISQRHPDLAQAVQPLVVRLEHQSQAICHGDFSPKNFLVWPGRSDGFFTLVDYETAHYGDPTMDVGFFLSHLLLKTIRLSWPRTHAWQLAGEANKGAPTSLSATQATASTHAVATLTKQFWTHYRDAAQQISTPEYEHWSRLHCAACMLARIDGTSPVDYLPEEPLRNLVRRFAKSLFFEPTSSWDELVSRLYAYLPETERTCL